MAITKITNGGNTVSTAGTSITATTAADIPAGSAMLGAVWCSAASTLSFGDGTTNVYSTEGQNVIGGTSGFYQVFFIPSTPKDIPNGSTLTGSSTTSAALSMGFVAFSNVNVLDVYITANASTAPMTVTSPTLVAAAEAVVGVGVSYWNAGGGVWTTASGFTNATSQKSGSSHQATLGIDYDIVSSKSAVTFAPSVSQGNLWGAGIWSFYQTPPSFSPFSRRSYLLE
jgi:hypothetical protein